MSNLGLELERLVDEHGARRVAVSLGKILKADGSEALALLAPLASSPEVRGKVAKTVGGHLARVVGGALGEMLDDVVRPKTRRR
jgi:hypothetical protein